MSSPNTFCAHPPQNTPPPPPVPPTLTCSSRSPASPPLRLQHVQSHLSSSALSHGPGLNAANTFTCSIAPPPASGGSQQQRGATALEGTKQDTAEGRRGNRFSVKIKPDIFESHSDVCFQTGYGAMTGVEVNSS